MHTTEPAAVQLSRSDLDGNADRVATTRSPPVCRANFFVVNPHADQVDVSDSGAFSNYHALQLELRRRLSRGLSFNGSYQYALEGGSAFLGFHYGRVMNPVAQRPSRDQDAVGLDDPGRPRPTFGRNMNPVAQRASSAAGSSTAPAASRRAR